MLSGKTLQSNNLIWQQKKPGKKKHQGHIRSIIIIGV